MACAYCSRNARTPCVCTTDCGERGFHPCPQRPEARPRPEPPAVTADTAIEVLNRIHEEDQTVLPRLITTRVPCNETLAEDPTVQVGGEQGAAFVGFRGILNGIFGVQPGTGGGGWIAASYDEETGDLTHFGRYQP